MAGRFRPLLALACFAVLLAGRPTGGLSFGARGSQLAAMAVGLNTAFVLQSSGSALYRMRESILGGLKNGQPALFSIFSGSSAGASTGPGQNTPETPPYLRAAAAMESRAFPAFVFDPRRGDDWASRFSIAENPQAGAEWPVHRFCYEDDDLQKISDDIAFTFVDFAAADRRYEENFANVPRSEWLDAMIPVDTFLKLDARAAAEKVPYILMVDDKNALHKVIVDVRLIQAAHRCRQMWRNLQELGGIDNSHARNLLAKEKDIWELELEALRSQSEPEPVAPAPEQPAAVSEKVVTEEVVLAEAEMVDEPAAAPLPATPRFHRHACASSAVFKPPRCTKYTATIFGL